MVPVAEVGRAALECKVLTSGWNSIAVSVISCPLTTGIAKSTAVLVHSRAREIVEVLGYSAHTVRCLLDRDRCALVVLNAGFRTANDLQKIIDITQHVLDSPAQAAARKTKPTRRRRIREEVIDSHHDEPSPSPDNDRAEVPTVGPSETRPSDPVDDTAMDVGDDETLDKAGVVPTKLNRMARRRCIADSSDDDEPGNVDDNGADKQNPDDADRTVGDVPDGSSVEGRSAAADDECVDERMNLSATLENADDGSTLADAQTMELEGTMGSSTQVLDEDDARDAAEGVGLSEHGSVGSAPPTR